MLTTRPSGIIIDVKNPSGRRPTQSDMSDCDHQWSVAWYANESALRSTFVAAIVT